MNLFAPAKAPLGWLQNRALPALRRLDKAASLAGAWRLVNLAWLCPEVGALEPGQARRREIRRR